MKAEIVRQELKHKKQWDDLKSINIANEKELEQIQVSVTILFNRLSIISFCFDIVEQYIKFF